MPSSKTRVFVLLLLFAGLLCGGYWYSKHRSLSEAITIPDDEKHLLAEPIVPPDEEAASAPVKLSPKEESAIVCSKHCHKSLNIGEKAAACASSPDPCANLGEDCNKASPTQKVSMCMAFVDQQMQQCLRKECHEYLDGTYED